VVAIDPGWHINPSPASLEYLIPTTLTVASEPPLRIVYPAPVLFASKFLDRPIKVYEGTVRILAEFSKGRGHDLRGMLTVQACSTTICLPPMGLPLASGPSSGGKTMPGLRALVYRPE
jgi:hypothetical protein